MNWNLSTQACCSLTEDTIDLFDWLHLLSATQYHDWVFPLLPEMWQNLRRQMFVQCFTWNFRQIIMFLSTPSVRSWWSQWEVMAACCCCSWRRCWSNILWVTLIRLWLLIVMFTFQVLWSSLWNLGDLFSVFCVVNWLLWWFKFVGAWSEMMKIIKLCVFHLEMIL
jgi:hypothetical protein